MPFAGFVKSDFESPGGSFFASEYEFLYYKCNITGVRHQGQSEKVLVEKISDRTPKNLYRPTSCTSRNVRF